MSTFVHGTFCLFLGLIMSLRTDVDASCFTMPTISEESINVITETLTVPPIRRGGQVTYNLQVRVLWGRPSGDNFDDFEVWLSLVPISQTRTSCTAKDGGHLSQNKTVYVFSNLLYGYQYAFQVRTYDSKTEFYSLIATTKLFTTPDCFQETKDASYCSEQSILTIGAPTFFTLHEVVAMDDAEAIDVTAVLRWSKPIQINGTLNNFVLTYNVQGGGTADVTTNLLTEPDLDILGNETTGTFYEYEVPDTLVNGETYDFKIRPYCRKPDERDPLPGADISISVPMTVTTVQRAPPVQTESSVQTIHVIQQNGPIGNQVRRNNPLFDLDPITRVPTSAKIQTEAPSKETAAPASLTWQVWSAIGASTFLMFVAATCCLREMVRKRKAANRSDELLSDIQSKSIHHISGKEIQAVRTGVPDVVFKNRELDRSMLKLDRELGSGQFGIVYKAYAFGVDGAKEFVPVAVKCLKENADMNMKEDFLDEIRLLIEIGSHPNILSVLGCCTIDEPYYLITEYMRYGDLLRFLWKSREERYRIQDAIYNVTQENKLQISRQIARGMEYLSKTRYYHGDLAARNILVGENLVVKISDFGLADDIYQAGYKRLSADKKRPVKWVSLETNTTGKCTIQSDVWSYGIVLYEIYTSGGVPYPGMSGRELIQKLQDGYRMERPDECPDEIYEVMLSCWQVNPSDRPTFNTLYRIMDCLLAEQSDYLATEEEKTTRILPLIKTTSTSSYGSGQDKSVPVVPERPKETLMEDDDDDEDEVQGGVDGGQEEVVLVELDENATNHIMECRGHHINEVFEPDVEGSGGGVSMETFLEEDDRVG